MMSANSEARKKMVFKDDANIKVRVGTAEVTAEVAKSNAKRRVGLGGRERLDAQEGMFFIFDKPGKYSIVNKGMLFMIDIIWIRDNAVVDMSQNMPDFKALPNYTVTPGGEAEYVLEVTAGFVKKYNIKIGDPVHWKD